MNPVIFTIFNLEVKWYSIFILIGIIIAWALISHESKKFKISSDFVTNLLFWTIIMGIIGARLYYVLFNFDYYKENIGEIFKIWEGGLAIHGGIILGGLTLILYCRKYKVSALRMLDISVPYLLLAQAIGRWGNFFNSEAFGPVTSYAALKNVKIIPEFVITGMNINGAYHVPTFYYESLWCLLGFIILLILRKLKYARVGQTFSLYLIWYSVGRFFIEGLRTDSLMIGEFKAAQIVSVFLFIIGIIVLLIQFNKPKLEGLYNTKEKVEVVNF